MIGIDEVGRGAWAGPLLVVAVRLKKNAKLPVGLKDSKQLSNKKRQNLSVKIADSCDIAQGWVSADIIDEIGLSKALKSATLLCLMQLEPKHNEKIIIDGNVNFTEGSNYSNVIALPKADVSQPIVSCASIVAKVLRDNYMLEQDDIYPGYDFFKHVGYGTKTHHDKLKKLGISKIHRKSFKPIRNLL